MVDKRIPEKCLTPFWIYNCDGKIVNRFICDFHNVPTDKCICDIDSAKNGVLERIAHHGQLVIKNVANVKKNLMNIIQVKMMVIRMNEIARIKNEVRLKQWTEMVRQRNESGLNVSQWCRQNGINQKTY